MKTAITKLDNEFISRTEGDFRTQLLRDLHTGQEARQACEVAKQQVFSLRNHVIRLGDLIERTLPSDVNGEEIDRALENVAKLASEYGGETLFEIDGNEVRLADLHKEAFETHKQIAPYRNYTAKLRLGQ